MKIICFHNPNEENGYLSNWYLSGFEYGGKIFSSVEQYMMYQKAVTFNDSEIAEQILRTDDVGYIKSMGRAVRKYSESIWNGRRQIIVYRGLLAKFEQSISLRNQLMETGEAILAECAVKDRIWGIGLSMSDENRFQMDKWRGQNLLGYALMEVREQLR